MYEIYWYGSFRQSTDDYVYACFLLARLFDCTGLERSVYCVDTWAREGNMIIYEGKTLNTWECLCLGDRKKEHYCSYEYVNADRFRKQAVFGVRKIRGGRGYYRRIKTTQENRINLGLVKDFPEFKNVVRPTRRKLPTAYDDVVRYTQDSWKAQHKGRKSWGRKKLRSSS